MPTAFITGATAGIGAGFARKLAADGFDLVLLARDEKRLDEQADEHRAAHGVSVETLAADLATDEGIASAESRLSKGVDLLVNNAGFAHRDMFLDVPVRDEMKMLRVHCEAVLRLTRAALPPMLDRGKGGIINVASVAGFFTGGTYSASKAWVISYSQAVAKEFSPRGVFTQALCPGYTHTEFHQRADLDMSGLPGFMWLNADRLVAESLRGLRRGVVICVPGAQYKAIVGLGKMLPLNLTAAISTRLDSRRRRR